MGVPIQSTKETRSPKEPQEMIVAPAVIEYEMLEQIEAQKFCDLYLKYMNLVVPMTTCEKLMNPSTPAQKVQMYSALAYSARICGDHLKSRKYISQARLSSGTIYDSIDSDSVCALLMMSNFWQLVLDIPLSTHYSKLASSLCTLLPPESVDERIYTVCEVSAILTGDNNNQKKAKLLKRAAAKLTKNTTGNSLVLYGPLFTSFLNFSALMIETLGYNTMFMTTADCLPLFFSTFDHVNVSEEKRIEVLKEANNVNIATALLQGTDFSSHIIAINSIFTPMYLSIIEWRSGHHVEALNYAINCLVAINSMENSQSFAYACGMVDFPHVVLLGGMCQLLYKLGHYSFAAQLCDKILVVCKILSPEFDFLKKYVDEFMAMLPPDSISPSNNSTSLNFTSQITQIKPHDPTHRLIKIISGQKTLNTNNINNINNNNFSADFNYNNINDFNNINNSNSNSNSNDSTIYTFQPPPFSLPSPTDSSPPSYSSPEFNSPVASSPDDQLNTFIPNSPLFIPTSTFVPIAELQQIEEFNPMDPLYSPLPFT